MKTCSSVQTGNEFCCLDEIKFTWLDECFYMYIQLGQNVCLFMAFIPLLLAVIHVNRHTCIYTNIHVHASCVHTCIHICTYIYMNTNKCIHTYIYTYIILLYNYRNIGLPNIHVVVHGPVLAHEPSVFRSAESRNW